MCGIAGFFGDGSEDDARRMIQAINYRGPDFTGVYSHENVHLSHARLSIIDLSETANQPMHDGDNRYSIVFNGEIYNFQELKNLLEKSGVRFHTHSDTEVLLHLYIRHGFEMLNMLNGMFALGIYDSMKRELFIARDRMGKKPVYYTQNAFAFVFASELKSIVTHPTVTKKLNYESLNRYLTFDYVPGPETIFENIFKLEPGHCLLVRDRKIVEKKKFWEHRFEISDFSWTDSLSRFDQLMNDATQRRLMSDVPLGIFLSGGLDSSTVAYYAQKNSSQKIQTFSIGFSDTSYDEQTYASLVAGNLGTDHHVAVLNADTTLKLIDEIYPKTDEPFADASLIPTYFLSQFTRKHVTVALGGDGSDELLAGYPTFSSDRIKNLFHALPPAALRSLKTLSDLLPVSDKNISFDFKVKQFLRGFSSGKNYIHQLWLGSFIPEEKEKLLKPDIYDRLRDKTGLALVDTIFSECPSRDDFSRIQYYYYKTYLPDDILFKVDRASMYNSLEVRAPFLDVHVVEFLNSLPKSFKIKSGSVKRILKEMMRGKLPDQIIDRPKKGFGIPLSSWIRKELKKNIEELLLTNNEFFNLEYTRKILDEHQSGKRNHRKLIWNLYMFLYWHKTYFR